MDVIGTILVVGSLWSESEDPPHSCNKEISGVLKSRGQGLVTADNRHDEWPHRREVSDFITSGRVTT